MFSSNNTVQERAKAGGRSMYCCVPECGSSFYDNNKMKTNISLFSFPNKESKPDLHKAWKNEILKYRRKGGADKFEINQYTKVCQLHFSPNDIKVSIGRGIKTLKSGAVPSVFNFKSPKTVKRRKSPLKRQRLFAVPTETHNDNSSNEEAGDNLVYLTTDDNKCENCENITSEKRIIEQKLKDSEEKCKILQEENKNLKTINEELRKREFTYDNLKENEKFFKAFTGIKREKFEILFEYLDPGADCENIKYHYPNKNATSGTSPLDLWSTPSYLTPESKPGPKPKMKPANQLFMFLTWLRLGISLKFTSWLFNTPQATVSRYLISWSNFVYLKLGAIPIWANLKQLQENMPKCFKETYPSTKVIIDCTELFCQKPSSLTIQSSLFSHYKHHVTYKGLVGIAPSGAITFVSELFDGSISDVEIVKRSGFLQKELWEQGDSVMADRGFTIDDLLQPLGVSLNIPAFLSGRSQLSHNEVTESQTIAAVRIHVERAIQRIKRFRQIRNEIPLSLHGTVNQIWTVCCLLCNFMDPLIKE